MNPLQFLLEDHKTELIQNTTIIITLPIGALKYFRTTAEKFNMALGEACSASLLSEYQSLKGVYQSLASEHKKVFKETFPFLDLG